MRTMTHIRLESTQLTIEFPGWEAMMTGRSRMTVPLAAVRGARAEEGWTHEMLGIRSGLVVSGFRKLGTFRHPDGTRRLVAMRRGMPLLRLAVDRDVTGVDEILVSTPEAARLAGMLAAPVSR